MHMHKFSRVFGEKTVRQHDIGATIEERCVAFLDAYQESIRLTDKETSILKFLYRSGDKPVARDRLLDEVWGYNAAVTTHTPGSPVRRP